MSWPVGGKKNLETWRHSLLESPRYHRKCYLEQTSQANIASHVSSAMVGMADFVIQLKNTEISLRGISTEMTELNRVYATLPEKMRVELAGTLRDYADTGAALKNSATMLDYMN